MNNYNDDFKHAVNWADKHKMDDNAMGATALAGFLVLSMLNELNFKFEQKTQNYKGVSEICENYLIKYENSTNHMVILTTTFLNVGLDALHEMNKKINKQPNQSEDLIERINIWIHDMQNKDYHKSFKIVTDALTSFNEKINLTLELKEPVDKKETLRKKYRSSL